jgi:hypothetical protein
MGHASLPVVRAACCACKLLSTTPIYDTIGNRTGIELDDGRTNEYEHAITVAMRTVMPVLDTRTWPFKRWSTVGMSMLSALSRTVLSNTLSPNTHHETNTRRPDIPVTNSAKPRDSPFQFPLFCWWRSAYAYVEGVPAKRQCIVLLVGSPFS